MAGRIRQEDLEAVRERADIAQVIGGYSQLRKAGRDSLVGLCPFHPEKTPSLSVSPGKQVYYCFGCGEGGDVFGFLRKVENVSFSEAVERVAKDVGIALRYEGETVGQRRAADRRQALYRANAEAAHLFNRLLVEGREGEDARVYLASRGISKESIERFEIGYSPGYPDFLLKRMSKTYSPEILLEAGLVAKDASGVLRDRFRGRVMFPIHDVAGNSVGFGGRVLEGERRRQGTPKYVNSPDTAAYHKGSLLYNLNRAKAEITRSARVFLVEGYTDVVLLDQAGVPAAVATCGTALGEEHVRLLARFADAVVLAFDSDEAGARAAERAYQFHERYGAEILVLILPEGQDPAEFVGLHGGDAFLELAERAVPLVEFMIVRALQGRDLTDVETRARAVHDGLRVVAGLTDPVRRHDYAGFLADRVGVPVASVLLELERFSASPVDARSRPATRMPVSQKVEREALKLLVQAPHLSSTRLSGLTADRFSTAGYRSAFELIAEVAESGGDRPRIQELVAKAQDRSDQLGRLVAALAVEPPESEAEVTEGYVERVFLRLDELALARQIDATRKELGRLNPFTSPEQHDALFEKLIALEGERRRVRAAAEAVTAVL